MKVRSNQTRVRAQVRAIRPAEDGWGAEVDLEVLRLEPSRGDSDFLGAAPGQTLTAFSAEPEGLHVGDQIRATLSLNAGPFGGRTLLRSFSPARS